MYGYIGVALVAALVAGGSAWTVRDWKAKADAAAVTDGLIKAQQMQQDRADKADVAYSRLRAQRDETNRQIDKETFDVVEAPVYRNECIDADGLRLVAAALGASAPSVGVAASAVPHSGSTD